MSLTKQQVHSAFINKLKESALEDQIEGLGLKAYSQEEVTHNKLCNLLEKHFAGFVIPYYDVQQKLTQFFRYRFLEPAVTGFAAIAQHKEQRYTQPRGMKPQVYFPPTYPWKEYLKQESRVLFITEGELKAACACKFGYPTVALGGVWNFRSAKANLSILPELKELQLKGVQVYIVYDSDAVSNPNVLQAENALAKELLKSKAHPYVLRLPALPHLKKTGLDDYLVTRRGSFDKLVEEAEEWIASRALHELNERIVFLHDSSTILEIGTGNRWNVSKAVKEVLFPLTYHVLDLRKKDPVMVEKRTAVEWIKWSGRAELKGLDYVPGQTSVYNDYWNVWRGWGVKEEHVKRGDPTPWRMLLDYIFKGHPAEHRKWFEQWVAYPLQNPGAKLYSAAVLWGRHQGTGKTLVGHTLQRIYGTNYTEVGEEQLHAAFNEYVQHKQFGLGEEITGGDKRGVAERLKRFVTRKEIYINAKYVPGYTIKDCINWLFTSNHCDAFYLEDEDRRFFVIEVKHPPLEREFYRKYDEWYKSDHGVGALFHHLLHVDLTGFDPGDRPPMTESKKEMIELGRSDVESWIAEFYESPDEGRLNGAAKRTLWTAKEQFAKYEIARPNTRVTFNGFCRALRKAGKQPVVVKTVNGTQKLFLVRASSSLVKPTDYAKVYAEERRVENLIHQKGKL